MNTVTIPITDILTDVLAADGIRAVLDARQDATALITPDHEAALRRLLPHALALSTAAAQVSAQLDSDYITAQIADTSADAFRAVVVWYLQYLCYSGIDSTRAAACLTTAQALAASLATTLPAIPPLRPHHI